MTCSYTHTQRGGFWFYVTAIFFAFLITGFLFVPQKFSVPVQALPILIIAIGAMLWAVLLLSSLTVKIEDDLLKVRFGPGVFCVNYNLSDIVSCRPVRNHWWYGWGIRLVFIGWIGWLYNIDGLDAIEIKLKDSRIRRIGSDQPKNLTDAINNTLGRIS